jgi:EmrB/QacA subfamily drug resistance transporter
LSGPAARTGLPRHVVVPLIVASALFLQQVDSTALATALPAIAEAFDQTTVRTHLVLTSYLFSLAAFIPISGWVADRFGAKLIFRLAIGIFTLSSLACGLTNSFEALIAARILQGLGGAMMVPVGRLILLRSVDRSELVKALALMSMPSLVGPIMGPILGGFLTSYASWRWVFWINLPFGILGIVLVTIFIEDVREAARRKFDTIGVTLCSVGLSSLLFGVDTATSHSTSETLALGCVVAGALCLGLYVLHAKRQAEPVINLALFRIPTFNASVIGGSVFRIGVGAMPFLLPVLFQEKFGYTAFQSGSITFVAAVGAFGIRSMCSRILGRVGFRTLLFWCGLVAAGFTSLCGTFRPSTPLLLILAILFFGGVFRSLELIAINALTYADIPPAQMSDGTTLATIVQRLAQSMGVAIGAFILHIASGPDGLTFEAFGFAFGTVGAMAVVASFLFIRLDPGAGSDLTGHSVSKSA